MCRHTAADRLALLGLALPGVKCQSVSQSISQCLGLAVSEWDQRQREWEGAGAGMSGGPCSLAPLDWAGLGLPHCMIGPPNFPSYNLSTCNLPHQRPQPFRFPLTFLSLPSCDKPQSFTRDFFTSKQSRKTKPHPISVPLQSGQSPSTHPQVPYTTPFPKTNSPRPRQHQPGLVARWLSPCIIVVIATLCLCPCPAPICPPYTAPLAPRRTHLQSSQSHEAGSASALLSPTAAPGVAGLAYTRNPTAERGASFLVMKSTTRNSASTPSSLITCPRCYSSASITIIPSFGSHINLISLTLPLRSLLKPFLPPKPEFRLSADNKPRLRDSTPTKWVTRMLSTWPSSPSRLSAMRVCIAFDTVWRPVGRADFGRRDGREHEDRCLRGP